MPVYEDILKESEYSKIPNACAFGIFGGDGGIRTLDLTDANRTLSQLSYAPVCSLVSFKHYITNFPFVKKNIDSIEKL